MMVDPDLDFDGSPNETDVLLVTSLHHVKSVINCLFLCNHELENLKSADLFLTIFMQIVNNSFFLVVVKTIKVILELSLRDFKHVRRLFDVLLSFSNHFWKLR
jgi:hypothetical protein